MAAKKPTKPAKKAIKKKEAPKPKPKPLEHELVPKHELLPEKEVDALLKEYGIQKMHLPKILKSDPALRSMDVERGDVIKITRNSPTTIKSYYYRVVI